MLSFFFITSHFAYASITPSATELFIGGKSGRSERLRIYNNSDAIAYVKIGDVYRVINPGTVNQNEEKVDNLNEAEILVTPRQLVIQPNSDMDIAIYDMLQERGVEAAYYFKIERILPPSTGNINVNIAYRILVRASPNLSKPLFLHEVTAEHIILKNRGNTRLSFKDAKWCQHDEMLSCYPLDTRSFRIYPGVDKKIPIRKGYVLHLLEIYPDHKRHLIK